MKNEADAMRRLFVYIEINGVKVQGFDQVEQISKQIPEKSESGKN